jgi:hypothetical protein
MDDSAMSPREIVTSSATPDSDAARVARASVELGVPVPPTFRLAGVDEGGSHLAHLTGTAQDIRYGSAILARLNRKPVDQGLADMTAPLPEGGPRPPWAPPDDWTDTEAMLEWSAERKRHPEWPQFSNSVSDWAPIVAAFLGGSVGIKAITTAITSTLNQRARLAFARYVVDQAVAQGIEIDPVALINAANSDPATGQAPNSGTLSGGT